MDLIDASSVASLHAAFKAARAEFEAAVQVANPRWEQQLLEPEDGGDEAWPAHMAAAHTLIGERWHFRYLALLFDTPEDGPLLTQQAFADLPSEQLELSERRPATSRSATPRPRSPPHRRAGHHRFSVRALQGDRPRPRSRHQPRPVQLPHVPGPAQRARRPLIPQTCRRPPAGPRAATPVRARPLGVSI